MQLGIRNEGLGIEMDAENCLVLHRSGHADSAGVCAICGRYVGEIAIILYYVAKLRFFSFDFFEKSEMDFGTDFVLKLINIPCGQHI